MGMKDFQFSFNGSLIMSRVLFPEGSRELTRPMQGQSPYLINTGLFYQRDIQERHSVSCSVLYNRIGKRLIGVGRSVGLTGGADVINIPDSYEMPRNALDLNFQYKLNLPSDSHTGSNIAFRFSAKDVIGEPVLYQQIGVVSLPEAQTQEIRETTRSFRPGRNFILSVQYTF